MSPNIKFTYFATRGYGELIRLLLKYGGIEFEDVRVEYAEWPKIKRNTPFGQLPIYEEDGKVMWQSNSIARYIARKVNLCGGTDWEDIEIDAIVDTIEDFKTKVMVIPFEKDLGRKEKLKETVMNETLPYYLKRFDDIARENNGHLAIKKLTWADVLFTTLTDGFMILLGENILDNYKNLLRVRENVLTVPAIKSWVNTRPKTAH